MTYLLLPTPIDLVVSLTIVGVVVGIFLVRYRSKKTRVNWKVSLMETIAIVVIATIASLVLGGIA